MLKKATLIVLVTILFSRYTFYSCIMSHSANGEEFLSFAKILIFFFCSTILPFICKYVLVKMIDYLTFTAVTGILNTSVHLFFLNKSRVLHSYLPVPFPNREG